MANIPLRIGVIGYRGFGAFCTGAYHQAGIARVVAFAGRDETAMKAEALLHGVSHCYTDWRQLIADPDVDLVHIVTPPDLHAEMAVAALEAGKHVLVEKPLATSNAEADAILQAAEKAGRIAGINYVMRYDPLYQKVAQIARSGFLGELTHAGFENYASDEGLNDSHWFWDRHASGGIFIEHGVHFFDMIGHIVGAPAAQVRGQTWTRPDGTNKEDRVQATVTYQNGVDAVFYHAFNRPGALERQTACFAFERGHIRLEGWVPVSLQMRAIIDKESLAPFQNIFPALEIVQERAHKVRGHGREYDVQYHVSATEQIGDPTDVYRQAVCAALSDLIQAIQDSRHALSVTAADGACSLHVAVAAQKSADNGGAEVRISPQK